jgi:hypothetical protein
MTTQKDITLFFVWCWLELLKKREAHAQYMREYSRQNPEKKAAQDRKYYLANREKVLAHNRGYAEKHPEILRACKRRYHENHHELVLQRAATWQKENKIRRGVTLAKWYAKRVLTNHGFRIRQALSTRIWWALRRKTVKSAQTLELIGCGVEELKRHLETHFLPGMSWDNYGEWHIDHIRPCASFDLTDPAQQRACFNFKNLQPLWAKDNLSKGSKYAPKS